MAIKTHKISIRVTTEQLQELHQAAKASGLTLSYFVLANAYNASRAQQKNVEAYEGKLIDRMVEGGAFRDYAKASK